MSGLLWTEPEHLAQPGGRNHKAAAEPDGRDLAALRGPICALPAESEDLAGVRPEIDRRRYLRVGEPHLAGAEHILRDGHAILLTSALLRRTLADSTALRNSLYDCGMTTQADWGARVTRAIAAQIRRHRDGRLSAQVLSDLTGKLGYEIPRNTIADLESGRRASISVAELLVLSRALDIPPLLLLFPVDDQAELEVLPGESRPAWRAAQWFTGEGPFPDREDDDLVTIIHAANAGPARPLALRRELDRTAEAEIRASAQADAMDARASVAATDAEREAFQSAADAHREVARLAGENHRNLRSAAAASGYPPPAPFMRFRIPEDDAPAGA